MKTWIVIGVVFAFLVTALNLGLYLKTKEIITKDEKPVNVIRATTPIKANDWIKFKDSYYDNCVGRIGERKDWNHRTGEIKKVSIKIYCPDKQGSLDYVTIEDFFIKDLVLTGGNDGT